MQQHEHIVSELDIHVLIVTFEHGGVARAYVEESGLPWPILVDESRALYHAYGMLRGRVRDIWGPRTVWAYAKEFAKGRVPRAPSRGVDTHQLGGDVLIDPSGIVRLLHVGSGPGDRPSVATLLAARKTAGRSA